MPSCGLVVSLVNRLVFDTDIVLKIVIPMLSMQQIYCFYYPMQHSRSVLLCRLNERIYEENLQVWKLFVLLQSHLVTLIAKDMAFQPQLKCLIFFRNRAKGVLHTREGFPVFLPGTRLFCNMLIVSCMRKIGVPDTLEFMSICNGDSL